MKQHITHRQLEELTYKEMEKLRTWWLGTVDSGYYSALVDAFFEDGQFPKIPPLPIGKMIEFLSTFATRDFERIEFEGTNWIVSFGDQWKGEPLHKRIKLCDALWEAVKEVVRNGSL